MNQLGNGIGSSSVTTGQRPRPSAGLQARLLIVLMVLAAIWTGVAVARNYLLLPNLPFDLAQVIQAIAAGLLVTLTVWAACRWLDRRTLRGLGLGRFDGRAFATGAGLWLGLAAAGLATGNIIGAFQLKLASPSALFLGWLALQLFLVFCFEAFPEELALRGYVFTNLAERMPRWVAVLAQAVLFMLWAFATVSLNGLAGLENSWSIGADRIVLFLTFGATLALVRLWTGSLWGSIGYHLAFQAIAQLLAADRLIVVSITDGAELQNAYFFLWLFAIILGGVVAVLALRRKERAH